jgi:cytochrome c peroxidase
MLAGAGLLVGGTATAQPVLDFGPTEVRGIGQHGPWPPPAARDPSNRASGDPRAAALGQRLFFDPRLSATGSIACATCHAPERAWTDGRARGAGLAPLDRNTPTLLDVALHRWFAWDGRSDSLWSQGLKAILDPREMGASARHVATLVGADPALGCLYERAYGPRHGADAERVLVDVGKALAAFLETIRSARNPFDDFRDALLHGDRSKAAAYPLAAQRGLRIFVGPGRCSVCHLGPQFTNGEFHDVGIPFLVGPGRVDGGRHEGIKRLRADPFNLLGPYSDDATGAAATKTRHVEPQHTNFGQFKTPSLRNVARTAPYMHDGRLPTLRDVVHHYSQLDTERIHTHGEQLLRPLRLSEAEVDDLVTFLESLTAVPRPPPAAALGACGRD